MAAEESDGEVESVTPGGPGAAPPDANRRRVLLVTGAPGVGKTTALRRVAARLEDLRVEGFFTEEVRDGSGDRVGFRARSFDADDPSAEAGGRVIASVDFDGTPRVGKYGVDVPAVDEVSERHLDPGDGDVVIVDEIGKMECHSDRFVARMRELLEGETPTVAAVSRSGDGLIREVKESDRTETWEITRENRDRMPGRVAAWVRERAGS